MNILKTIFNVMLLGLPYIWKFIKDKWGAKIDDRIEAKVDKAIKDYLNKE